MLPIVCLGISLLVGFGISKKKKQELFIREGEMDSDKLFRNWHFLVRWFVPAVIILGFVSSFFF
jgi:SNF family Na+-dependent transporter